MFNDKSNFREEKNDEKITGFASRKQNCYFGPKIQAKVAWPIQVNEKNCDL